jgi:hypothetical protein
MNSGHVWSIFLCSFYYVMVLLLFWGHEPGIGFFLQWFNMPDALICYPGSIEKLKLLGATYLLTYLKGTGPTTGRIQPQRVTTGISSGNSQVYWSVNKSWLG